MAASHNFKLFLFLLSFVVEFVHFIHVGVPIRPFLQLENLHLGDQVVTFPNSHFDLILGLFYLHVLLHLHPVKVLNYFYVFGFGLAPLTNLLAEQTLVANAMTTLRTIIPRLLDLFLEKPKLCFAPEAVRLLKFSDSRRSHARIHTDFRTHCHSRLTHNTKLE